MYGRLFFVTRTMVAHKFCYQAIALIDQSPHAPISTRWPPHAFGEPRYADQAHIELSCDELL